MERHTQHMISTRSAILLYNRVGACIGRRRRRLQLADDVRFSRGLATVDRQCRVWKRWAEIQVFSPN